MKIVTSLVALTIGMCSMAAAQDPLPGQAVVEGYTVTDQEGVGWIAYVQESGVQAGVMGPLGSTAYIQSDLEAAVRTVELVRSTQAHKPVRLLINKARCFIDQGALTEYMVEDFVRLGQYVPPPAQ